MRWVADLCYLVFGLLYLPVLLYGMMVQGKNRRGWRERFGSVARRHGDRPCIWIHGVSLGEINATQVLVQQIRSAFLNADLVISTTTDTGYTRARELYPDLAVFRYPLDFSWVVQRVLKRIRPQVIVLMELEVWFNLVTMAAARGVRVCVANGRFTQRSADRLRLAGRPARRMFAALSWVGAQSTDIAARFTNAGVPAERVEVLGSMKWDTAVLTDHVTGAEALARALGMRSDRPLIVLGSSGPGEERLVVQAWRRLPVDFSGSQLAVIPRKPERFAEVARVLERLGTPCIRRSEFPDGCLPPTNTSGLGVFLGDTMGELRKFYALCDIAIVGRSFVPLGGSDPMEVAALAKPIIVGPHVDNFLEPVEVLAQGEALIRTRSTQDLHQHLSALLADAARRQLMGENGRRVVRAHQGATARTVERLRALLPTERHRS